MSNSLAVLELIAAANRGAGALEALGCFGYSKDIRAAAEAVKAEDKPQTHPFSPWLAGRQLSPFCAVKGCGQTADSPIHQTGGK